MFIVPVTGGVLTWQLLTLLNIQNKRVAFKFTTTGQHVSATTKYFDEVVTMVIQGVIISKNISLVSSGWVVTLCFRWLRAWEFPTMV